VIKLMGRTDPPDWLKRVREAVENEIPDGSFFVMLHSYPPAMPGAPMNVTVLTMVGPAATLDLLGTAYTVVQRRIDTGGLPL